MSQTEKCPKCGSDPFDGDYCDYRCGSRHVEDEGGDFYQSEDCQIFEQAQRVRELEQQVARLSGALRLAEDLTIYACKKSTELEAENAALHEMLLESYRKMPDGEAAWHPWTPDSIKAELERRMKYAR